MRRRNRYEKRLDTAKQEREQVREEGEAQKPMVRRLRRRAAENHFADAVLSVLARKRST